MPKRLIDSGTIVLLVTIDSLRRDYVGCYDPLRSNTPYLDSISTTGARFDSAFSQGGGTPDSFPSIMCSSLPPLTLRERRVQGRRKIAGFLKECGFLTGAFHSNPYLSASYGYNEGFDTFYDGGQAGHELPSDFRNFKYVFDQLLLNRGPISDGNMISRMAMSWMKQNGGKRPMFVWLHYMDNHFPYLPPVGSVGGSNSIRNRMLWSIMLWKKIQNKNTVVSPQTLDMMKSGYSACIKKIDACLANLVPEVLRRSSRNLIIVTSDHGEGFWEHGYFGHCGLYDEILRVPLICAGSEVQKGSVRNDLVTLSDIFPTIADFADREADKCEGRNLFGSQTSAIDQRTGFVCSNLDPPRNLRYVGLRNLNSKYIRSENLRDNARLSEELYDLNSDPTETHDILSEHPSIASQCLNEIQDIYSKQSSAGAYLTEHEESEILARLAALGYT